MLENEEVEFDVNNWVYLKISLMKDVMRFRKKEKLISYYVGPYKINWCFGILAYQFNLPSEIILVHRVFHVSLFKKCISDATCILPLESVDVKQSISYEKVLVEILDPQVSKLRNKKLLL